MGRILVIDDEEDIRDALRMVLERAGHEVTTASCGSEAIDLQHKAPAKVIITDIIMPDMDGVTTIRKIHKDFPDTRIIAISGGGGIEAVAYKPDAIKTTAYLAAAQEVGADRIFTKPFDRETLIHAVDELLVESPA